MRYVPPPHNISQLGSEENFQDFLARASYFVLFSPIPWPYLVEYIFIQQLNYSQKFINYRIDSALLHHVFFMFSYLVIQKLFRVEKHHRKGQSCELFFPILPITCPLSIELSFYPMAHPLPKVHQFKKAPALSYDLFYVLLDRLVQNLFQVENRHRKAGFFWTVPELRDSPPGDG